MDSNANIWYLENINLFNVFCPKKMKNSGVYNKNSYGKGEFIYFPNEPSETIYFIHQGKVKIGSYSPDGKEIIKAVLTKGELFGEQALVGEEKRADFAQALVNETMLCPLGLKEMESTAAKLDFRQSAPCLYWEVMIKRIRYLPLLNSACLQIAPM